MKAKTRVGSIVIDQDSATIARRAFVGQEEERTVRLDALTGIEYKSATAFSPGHLRLLHAGNTSSSWKLREYDCDTLMFDLADAPGVAPIRALLMERVTGQPFVDEQDTQRPASQAVIVVQLVAVLAVIFAVVWAAAR